MLRHRLTQLGLITFTGTILGCPRGLELDPDPISPDDLGVVIAQFDPSNPIPVLRLVPTPTGIVQNPVDGTFVQDMESGRFLTDPDPCEGPGLAQCLAFAEAWPANTPITLLFSGQVSPASVHDGVTVYEVTQNGLEAIRVCTTPQWQGGDCVHRTDPFPAQPQLPEACVQQYGDRPTYAPPNGIEVVVYPERPLRPGARYVLKAESYVEGTVQGVQDETGNAVEPAALFSLLNSDVPPVDSEGNVTSALIRSQIQGLVILEDDDLRGKPLADLTAEERAKVDAAVKERGKSVGDLYRFFQGIASAPRE